MNRFTEMEIPYDELRQFGLTQEMVDDLPQSVMKNLLSGRETPPLPIKFKDCNGVEQSYVSSILLKREQGNVSLYLIPMWTEAELDEFTKEQQDVLLRGEVLRYQHPTGKFYYAQYNDEMRYLMMVEEDIVRHNLEIINRDNDINQKALSQILDGKPTVLGEKIPVTVGINLKDWNAVHITDGDAEKWKEEVSSKLNKYNFGIYGCWICNPINGALSYIPEEQYTEEMENEMRRMGQQRVSSEQMSRLRR